MPDLNHVPTQTCRSNVNFTTTCRSRDGSKEYEVTWNSFNSGDYQYNAACTCPGFKFREKCRHIGIMNKKRCQWNWEYSAGRMGRKVEGKEERVCPECEGPVEGFYVGV